MTRKKDGKTHRYWSVVENRRLADGCVLQRHVLYLGEINDSQALAWRRSIEVLDEREDAPRTVALFPEDRIEECAVDAAVVQLRLSQLRLCHARVWGSCWLTLKLWEHLGLDLHHQRQPLRPSIYPWRPSAIAETLATVPSRPGRCSRARVGGCPTTLDSCGSTRCPV